MPALKSPRVFVKKPSHGLRFYFQKTLDVVEDPENLNGKDVMRGNIGLNPIGNSFSLSYLTIKGEPVISMAMYVYEEWKEKDHFIAIMASKKIPMQISTLGSQTSFSVTGIGNIIQFRETLREELGDLNLEVDELSRLVAHPELSGVVVDEALKLYTKLSKDKSSPFHESAYSHDWGQRPEEVKKPDQPHLEL